jgi:hypothetical protein
MPTYVSSYNDSSAIVATPANYDVAYMRGWDGSQDNPNPLTKKFFLDTGMGENWSTFNTELTAVEGVSKPTIFRIIDWKHVPSGWPVLTVDGEDFLDLRKNRARDLLKAELNSFNTTFGSRLFGMDINVPFGRVGEPSANSAMYKALGNGDESAGEQIFIDNYKWAIDTYVEIFGAKVIGNCGGSSIFDAEVFAHYRQSGIRAYRQDAFGRFDPYGKGDWGENRATRYDAAMTALGGRDKFDLLFFEVAGNGIQTHAGYPEAQMVGAFGEFHFLEATHLGNMGLPWTFVADGVDTVAADAHIADWIDFIAGGTNNPGPIYPVNLIITDSLGRTASVTKNFASSGCGTFTPNQPPIASFSWVLKADTTPTATITDASEDTDGTIVEWRWDFGDGTNLVAANGNPFDHTFPSNGRYIVTLTVKDDADQQDATNLVVDISGSTVICERPTNFDALPVVYDDDSANEGDGPYGIAHAIASPELDLKAMGVIGWVDTGAYLNTASPSHPNYESYHARRSYLVANRSRCLMGFNDTTIPLHHAYTVGLVGGNGNDENPAFSRDLSTNPANNPPRTVAAVAYADLIANWNPNNGKLWFIMGGQATNFAAAMRILIVDGTLTQTQINQRVVCVAEMLRVQRDASGIFFSDAHFNHGGDPVSFKIIAEAVGLETYAVWGSQGVKSGWNIVEADHPPGTPASGSGGDPLLDYALDRRKVGTDGSLDPLLAGNPQVPPADPAYFAQWPEKIAGNAIVYVACKRGRTDPNYVKSQLALPTFKQTGTYGDHGNLANIRGGGRTITYIDFTLANEQAVVADFWAKVRPFNVPINCGVTVCSTITNFLS